jgi:hypothetical protein
MGGVDVSDLSDLSREAVIELLRGGAVGVDKFNFMRVAAPRRPIYLSGADLSGADLRGANLSGADLRGANLGGTNLRGADLRGANLIGANLIGAYLSGADLRGANLSVADLRGANLGGVEFGGAKLGAATPRFRYELPRDTRLRFGVSGDDLIRALGGVKRGDTAERLRELLHGITVEVGEARPSIDESSSQHQATPESHQDRPCFSLYIDPGGASKETLREVLEALRQLYIAHGGDGLLFDIDSTGALVAEGVLS